MIRKVKNLRNNRKVIFDNGKFDQWCVYVVEENGTRKAPYDLTYFADLKQISLKYPEDKIYNDFLKIYNLTDITINQTVIRLIDKIVITYETSEQLLMEQWLTVLYAGMIAEENKAKAILKKRIKRLGMYQVLKQNIPPAVAAKFSLGEKWKDLDAIMKSYGF